MEYVEHLWTAWMGRMRAREVNRRKVRMAERTSDKPKIRLYYSVCQNVIIGKKTE
jgi:hypothetical protein